MPNVLKMEKQVLIKQLLALNWSYRRIESETGIRRETISKYDPNHPRHSKAAKVPTDSAGDFDQNRPEQTLSQAEECPPNKPTRTSSASEYDEFIRERTAQGLTAQRIYQDLVVEHDFKHSYDSVKRYVRKLKKRTPEVIAHIHAAPGEEGQVDFGQAAPTLKNGRYLKPWLFKMVLSHSRHSYEEVVWKQDVETFLACHRQAFESFGGVPKLVRLDNLKSGVLKAHLYEPELNPLYSAFAQHYGFTPLPCLPRKPEHKGKVESGIGYTKDNALKGLKFDSLDAQNAHLRDWNRRWARTRIHGTIKQQVWTVFTNVERDALQPLPEKPFQYFKVGKRKVHADGHIEVVGAYYSVPHHYLGQSLTVHFNAQWVKVLDGTKVAAFHRRAQPGRFRTDKEHLPEDKTISQEEYKTRLLVRCAAIGEATHRWAQLALKERKQLAFRAIQGLLRLPDKYATELVDKACQHAQKIGSVRYQTVATLCGDLTQAEASGEQLELIQEHDIIRDPKDYQVYIDN
ncbi:MAG: IS21 family transposase [bacterium]